MNYIDRARTALVEELDLRDAACDSELVDLYLLLVLTSGEMTDLEDVHDAWAAWTSHRRPGHRSLIEFDDLAPDVQQLDAPYRDAIRAAAVRIDDSGGPEHRVQVFVRLAHPAIPRSPEAPVGEIVLGRGNASRQLDVLAIVPGLLRDAADRLDADHLPADGRRAATPTSQENT